MKFILAAFFITIASPVILKAQRNISAEESSYSFKSGRQNAVKVIVYETDAKTVSKKWESHIKDYKGKTSGNKSEVFTDNASISGFNNNNTADIYAGFDEAKDGNTFLYVAVDLGGTYMRSSSHKSEFNTIKKIAEDFARKVSQESVEDQIKDAEKAFAKLEAEQKRLISDNETLHKNIETYNEKIKKAEEDIKTNLNDQETKKKELEEQLKTIEVIKEKFKSIN